MEKGSFRRHLREGADNLPSVGALIRMISSKFGLRQKYFIHNLKETVSDLVPTQMNWKKAAQIGVVTSIAGVGVASLYEAGQLWNSPSQPARVADNPNFAGPTALSLRPKVSEAVAAVAVGIEQYDRHYLEGRINPLDSNTFMNRGIASCKTGVALGLESEQTVLDRVLSLLSPTVAEAAPLEAESPEDLLRCVQDIEKQRAWFSRFGINVNEWNTGNFIGVMSIAEGRQELAGEIRKKGFDMTPEEMGSFIGDFIPVAIVDPSTGKVGTITLEFVKDKAEAEKRKVHWTGENMAFFFDDATEQIAAVLVNQDPLKKCHNGLIPFAPRAKEVPPTPTSTNTPQPTEQPAQPQEEQPGPGPAPENTPTPAPTPTPQPGEAPTATPAPGPEATATPTTAPTPTNTPGPGPTPTPTREATATPQPIPPATPTPTAEVPPTPTPTVQVVPTPTPTREATATPQPIPPATATREATATPQTRPVAPTATPGSAPKPEGSATPGSNPQAAPSKEPSRTPSQPTNAPATPSSLNPTREPIATPSRR